MPYLLVEPMTHFNRCPLQVRDVPSLVTAVDSYVASKSLEPCRRDGFLVSAARASCPLAKRETPTTLGKACHVSPAEDISFSTWTLLLSTFSNMTNVLRVHAASRDVRVA